MDIEMKRISIRMPFVIAISLLIILSCSKNNDMRDGVIKNYGEPDLIEEGGYGTYEWMRYVYAKRSVNRVYDFQKSASGCGGSGEWYIYSFGYADYLGLYPLYSGATITHSPILSASAGDVLIINSTLSDPDHLVKDYNLYYRVPGAEDFQVNQMALSDEDTDYTKFFATISGEEMTTAGIEYFIEMDYYIPFYDKLYVERLPETGVFTVEVTGSGAKPVTGSPQTTYRPVYHLEDGAGAAGGTSPVGP